MDARSPIRKYNHRVCDVTGKRKKNAAELYNLTVPYLKHFGVKTVEEYFKTKMNRGFPLSGTEN